MASRDHGVLQVSVTLQSSTGESYETTQELRASDAALLEQLERYRAAVAAVGPVAARPRGRRALQGVAS